MARAGESMSAEADWLVRNELASLEHAYESGDVLGVPAHCLLGVEINFAISMQNPTPEQEAALEASRAAATLELSLLVPKDEEQAQRKANWLQQVARLTPKELINYNIYRRLSVPTLDEPTSAMYLQADDSPETTLEFVFGNGLYQTGYYDNPGQFEARTQAAKPTIALERVQRVVAVATEVAHSFGARFEYKNDQTNFSVWVPTEHGLQPVHSLDSPEGQEIARKATAGMLHALRDSEVALHPPIVSRPPENRRLQITADPQRAGLLRVLPKRFEGRRSVGVGNHALFGLALMSGFAHGVTDQMSDTSFVRKERRDLLASGPGYSKARDLYLLRGLQQSELVDGRFVFGGISSIDFHRLKGMLSSIIGTAVYANRDGSRVIRELLGCMSLDPDGGLKADEQAFDMIMRRAAIWDISLDGTSNETITERLQRIRILRDCVTIAGSVDCEWPSGVTFHKDLGEFVAAPSLGYIGSATLEAVSRELSIDFTHEEAVARYYNKTVAQSFAPVSERVARLQGMHIEFPDADSDKVMQLVLDDLRGYEDWYAKRIAAYEAEPDSEHVQDDTCRYEDWIDRRADILALLQVLGARDKLE